MFCSLGFCKRALCAALAGLALFRCLRPLYLACPACFSFHPCEEDSDTQPASPFSPLHPCSQAVSPDAPTPPPSTPTSQASQGAQKTQATPSGRLGERPRGFLLKMQANQPQAPTPPEHPLGTQNPAATRARVGTSQSPTALWSVLCTKLRLLSLLPYRGPPGRGGWA